MNNGNSLYERKSTNIKFPPYFLKLYTKHWVLLLFSYLVHASPPMSFLLLLFFEIATQVGNISQYKSYTLSQWNEVYYFRVCSSKEPMNFVLIPIVILWLCYTTLAMQIATIRAFLYSQLFHL